MATTQTRRRVLSGLGVTASAALLPVRGVAAAEPPPETTTVRLGKEPAICFAPQYVVQELLRAEGFTDIRYVETNAVAQAEDFSRGRLDFASNVPPNQIAALEAGTPMTIVSGVHGGCYELFARGSIGGIRDLKGKTVGAPAGPSLLSMFTAWVGLDPKNDLTIVTAPQAMELFAQDKLDAYLAFPPEVQELRARKVGHVILRTAVDRPWSQYYCCMLAGHRDYVARYPIATARTIRAILKAAELCASAPERMARLLVSSGFVARYDYALQTLKEVPYDLWADYDPEDTVRFYALRMHDLGMIKSDAKRIIAEGTDFHLFEKVKRELKA